MTPTLLLSVCNSNLTVHTDNFHTTTLGISAGVYPYAHAISRVTSPSHARRQPIRGGVSYVRSRSSLVQHSWRGAYVPGRRICPLRHFKNRYLGCLSIKCSDYGAVICRAANAWNSRIEQMADVRRSRVERTRVGNLILEKIHCIWTRTASVALWSRRKYCYGKAAL